ncbi:M10 family metallopeptidase C-terminal domain-containing protein [Paracoccus onubensis]|uniref:Peptidase M10 serralysin C-terminal domain-containing protein n=1 Tax=Paracoccus onubensis TaxID=1675788 RepID=A0A418SNW4_9RHOB|nr:M10 family metallopeptidase C-terminal domain-containing protein [Paracoccus onubensis]RJE82650.1 hypothetical protein D3P04_18370 [Paracoccus onubensis]
MSYMSNVGGSLASNRIETPVVPNEASVTTSAEIIEGADAASDASTAYRINAGDSFSGNMTRGDEDWLAIELTAGETYNFKITYDGNAAGATVYVDLLVYDSDENQISNYVFFEDPTQIVVYADTTGTYYVDAYSWSTGGGRYLLQSEKLAPGTPNEIANHLTHGAWMAEDGKDWRAFDTSGSNRITADISGLNATERQVAISAMEAWEMVADIDFQIVSNPAAQIVFGTGLFDDTPGNFYGHFLATSEVTGNRITQSVVNVGTGNPESPLLDKFIVPGSYIFQTYLRELGRALGLGYSVPGEFANDSWDESVMSQIPAEGHGISEGFEENFTTVMTPRVADIVAIQSLYGVADRSSLTAGNTIWGENSNLSGYMANFTDYLLGGEREPTLLSGYPTELTIFDRDGDDTLNLSRSTTHDRISLRQEEVSDIYGRVGNLGIAQGTLIENLITGSGNDFIQGNSVSNEIRSGAGNDTVRGGYGADQLFGGRGNDRLLGETGNDILGGQIGDDRLYAGAGRDQLWGGDGNDTLYAGEGDDHAYGDAGNDQLFGGGGFDRLFGGSGNDRLFGGAAHDRLKGGGGHDLLNGGDGYDTLLGESGNDTLHGLGGNDSLLGHAGNDVLYGGGRADTLHAGIGDDRLYGEIGNDVLFGGDGRDKLFTGAGNDKAYGGTGKDDIFGGAGKDQLFGGAGNDHLFGDTGGDRLFGDSGNDAIFGGDGNDQLFGGAGADTLTGGGGRDTFTGGGGADMFLFSTGDGHDVIRDFSSTDAEDINLTQIIAINSFADLVNDHLRNVNGDAMIVYGTGSILLAGVNFGAVGFGRAYDADDFIF